ncbi:MAG: ADP-ribosylglycohydrolase family protein [Pseudolysinimonas sp.]
MSERQRALGALQGLAIGDALGMPTQLMSRGDIAETFGIIDGFRDGPADHPIAAGMPAGSITDDTEQALLVAHALIERDGHLDAGDLARRLAEWEDGMRARGSLDLLGPSTRAAVAAVLAGTPPEEAGRYGATNGAAMRVTPVGIAVPPAKSMIRLIDAVHDSARASHDTGVAISAAAAVAAAVSAGISGATWREATDQAVSAAQAAEARGHWVAGASVAARIRLAIEQEHVDEIISLIGTSLASQESVPAAFGFLAIAQGDGWTATKLAAAAGGDTDTIAAIAGAIAGACGSAFPDEAIATVIAVNSLDLEPVVDGLLALRAR